LLLEIADFYKEFFGFGFFFLTLWEVKALDKTIFGMLSSDLSVLISQRAARKTEHDAKKNQPKFFGRRSQVYQPIACNRL
jgi:hypothetical protein